MQGSRSTSGAPASDVKAIFPAGLRRPVFLLFKPEQPPGVFAACARYRLHADALDLGYLLRDLAQLA